MTYDSLEEMCRIEAAKLSILNHAFEQGSATVESVINAGLVDNPDDAVACMSRLVDSNKARWCEVGGMRAITLR